MQGRIRNFNRGINFIRAYSIIAIILYHIYPYGFKGGFMGVCFFFVISGYLTSKGTTFNDDFDSNSVRSYYKRRFFRIYPGLYIMMVSVMAYLTLFGRNHLDGIRPEATSIFLSMNNWWQIANLGSYFDRSANHSLFTHLWYLSVEVQLLILWPLLYLICDKLRTRFGKYIGVGFIAILAVISALLMMILYDADNINRIYYGTDTRAFAFLFGVILGLTEDDIRARCGHIFSNKFGESLLVLLLFANLILFWLVDGTSTWLAMGGMAIISLVYTFMIFVMNCSEFEFSELANSRVLDWIGRKSYLLYLWHYPLYFILVFLMRR